MTKKTGDITHLLDLPVEIFTEFEENKEELGKKKVENKRQAIEQAIIICNEGLKDNDSCSKWFKLVDRKFQLEEKERVHYVKERKVLMEDKERRNNQTFETLNNPTKMQ